MNDSILVGKLPQSADAILQMLSDSGIKNYEPQIIMQLTDFGHSLAKKIFEEAKLLSDFSGKKQIDKADIEFTIKVFEEKYKPNRPSKVFLMDLAAQKNSQPLAPLRQNFGLRLPNDRFCQVQPNYEFSAANANASLRCVVDVDKINYAENKNMSFSIINNMSAENVSNMLADNGRRDDEDKSNNLMPIEEDFD